jgi:hypothetical protein
LRAVQKELEQSGILAPSGGRQWSRTTIKNVLLEMPTCLALAMS